MTEHEVPRLTVEQAAELDELLRSGKRIAAAQFVRQSVHMDLKDVTDLLVDRADRLGVPWR